MAPSSSPWGRAPRVRLCSIILLLVFCTLASAQASGPYVCPNNGKKIPRDWVCNGLDDCMDGSENETSSDEAGCPDVLSCTTLQFACEDGRMCISEQHHCDGESDCNDNSDERGCPLRNCDGNEFECDDGSCVQSAYICDGQDDCHDNSDERNCTADMEDCYFYCNSTGTCIPSLWVCDGVVDCQDIDDELDCDDILECPFGMFNCTKGGCIKSSLVCDGTPDCPDESDEDCPRRECDREREFECAHSATGRECISRTWICDGSVDCFDEIGSDEINCIGSCEETEFGCVTGGQCVSISVQCDGEEDCSDGSDEYLCSASPPPIHCRDGTFPCYDGEQCVNGSFLCDGRPQCTDDSDENSQWCGSREERDECAGNHGCEHHCTDTHFSYFCSCDPGFYLEENRKNCTDFNECELRDTCSQLCCNTPGSYECHCVDGYAETKDGGCKPLSDPSISGNQGYLLIMDKIDIRAMYPNGRRVKHRVRDLLQTFAIDYHLRYQYMYWTELVIQGHVIKRALLNGSNPEIIIESGLKNPYGLAIDWIADKIYWTDASRSHVTVSDLTGTKRTVLFSDDMKKPRGIALDPTTGYMYWTDWGSSPRIERASMDGKNRIVLHSTNIVWPNALTIDYATQSLYWIDAKLDFIEKSFMDGSRRTVLYREMNRHFRPFGLTLFNDKLFMADIDARQIRSFNVRTGTDLEVVFSDFTEPIGVVAVHPVRQPLVRVLCTPKGDDFDCDCPGNLTEPVVNPCEVDNGGCEYLCLLSAVEEDGYSCACQTGYRLHSDGKNCIDLDNFLIVTDEDDVYIVSLDVPHPIDVGMPLVGVGVVAATTWDSRTDTLYLADLTHHTILSTNFTGEDQQVVIEPFTLSSPVGIALDWLHNRLYWADSGRDVIESSDLDGGQRSIVIYNDLDKPRDVVLDPERGLMFWSDWGTEPKIMRAAMDGTSIRRIVHVEIRTPNGLALDYENRLVYWADGLGDRIGVVNYDGSNPIILFDPDHDIHPAGLGLYNDWIYWTDFERHTVDRANIHNLSSTFTDELVVGGFEVPRDVNVFHRFRNHSAYTPCSRNNGGCSHVCVTKYRNSSRVRPVCMCPVGYPLLSDKRTCASVINTTLLFPTGSVLHQISLDITAYVADIVTPVPSPPQSVTAVTMDPYTNVVYYATTVSDGVHRFNVSDESEEVILDQHRTAIIALAVDIDSQNLYFVDSYENTVEVSRADGSNRRVLHNDLVSPTGLAMDPVSLSLFYIDTGDAEREEAPKIYSSAMDGSAQTVIVTDELVRPLYIAVDNNGVNGRIFWTDGYYNHIMTATFAGQNPQTITVFGEMDGASHVHGIAFFQDHIYFSDLGRNVIWKSDLFGEKSEYTRRSGYQSDVKVIERRRGIIRGCTNSSRCSYLCLPNPNVPSKQTCSCGTGIEMDADGSCQKLPQTFLLVAAQYSLRRIALDDPDGIYIDIPLYNSQEGYEVIAVDYYLTSPGEGYIFFCEMKTPTTNLGRWRSRIVRQNMTLPSERKIIREELGQIEDIAVDWTTGNVYFTMHLEFDSFIGVVNKDGKFLVTLVTTGIGKPRGIALHPLENLMFWTDFGSTPKIEKANMDGSLRVPVITRGEPFPNLRHPNDVAIDLNTDMVYFSDSSAGIIGVATLSGNGGRVIVNKMSDNPQLRRSQPTTDYIRKPRSLSIRHLASVHQDNDDDTEESELFWSDPDFNTISVTDLVTTGRRTMGIEKSRLRLLLSKATAYKTYAVQFVSRNGHKDGEISSLSTLPCSKYKRSFPICINLNSTHYKLLCPTGTNRKCPTPTNIAYSEATTPSVSPRSPPPPHQPQPSISHASTETTDPTPPPTTNRTPPPTNSNIGGSHSTAPTSFDEQRSNAEDDSIKDVGIGLGTIVVLLSIAFVVFVIVVLYLCVRTQNRYKQELHIQRFKSVQTSLQSLASPSLTVTSNNNFTLRKKESNVFRNNSSSRRKDTPQPQVPHSHSVNEFVEQPEVYKLDAVNTKKKHIPTPPDSPLLKQHHAPSEATPSSEPPDVKVVEATLECVEDEKREAEVLSYVPSLLERPSRSCLSSVSDSQKIKPEKNVKFVEDGDNQVAPPPPLPPKFQNGDDSSPPPPDDSPDENEDSSLIMPPPRPPKPLIVSSEIQKEESLPTISGAAGKKQCSAMEEEKVREKMAIQLCKDENMNADNAAGERMNGERFVEGDDSSEDDSSGGNSSSGDDGSSVDECVVELGYTGESGRRGEMEAYVYKRLDFDGETRSENSTESSL